MRQAHATMPAPLRRRAALMLSTALQAVALAVASSPAAAQLAANARPGGAQVSAGQASIGGNASTTLINQTSERAAINWQTYNVGSAQTVRYQQPNAGAVTLNTVLSANPSLIAGKILANGQIIIVNQSGVVFAKGSQVDTAGLVVSSAGISQKDFMAGRMVFSQAGHPGALISNAGNITVRQAGLAALVAPQVANSGTITANLGRVILAGATTHTLDLYGDGLVALNVTGQVTQVSLDGKLVPALVTNTGTILAPGGTVVLTAAAADGVVTNLVSAGGTIAAPSAGAQTGRVLVQGIGGGVSIDGEVSATGVAAGTKGGRVEVNATGAVSISPGALIDASGPNGGGIISVGTTAARAIGGASVHPTLTAQTVSIAPGARIRANATRAGQGGRIAVLSKTATREAGAITASGGPVSGAGGWIEVSGKTLALGGPIGAGAAHGQFGTILLDPIDMILEPTGTSSGDTLAVTQAEITRELTGNVILQATGTLSVAGTVTFGNSVKFLQLEGDQAIVIGANSGVNAPAAAVGLKSASGSITENASGSITATSISATAATSIDLAGQNTSTTIASFTNTATGLTLTGLVATPNGNNGIFGAAPTPTLEIAGGQMPGLTAGTTINLDVLPTPGSNTPNTLTLDGVITAGTLSSGAYSGSATLNVTTGNVVENAGASILTGTLSSGGALIGGSADFAISAGNTISTLTNFKTTGAFALEDDTALTVGSLASTGGAVAINGPAGSVGSPGSLTITGPVSAATTISLANPLGITLSGTLTAGTLAASASNGGTPYTGRAILDVTDGNIVETGSASIRAGTLTGEALSTAASLTAGSGNATFITTAGNTISTLTGFTAAGNFTLQDAAGLSMGTLSSSFGSLNVSGPGTGSPTGSLILAGDITAGTSISFSNALGISETAGAGVTSASGLSLSTGGSIVQAANASLTDGSSTGTAIALAASTGITLGGTLSAGFFPTNAGDFYLGTVSLNVGSGNIVENNGASIRAATLTGEALSTETSLSAAAGNAGLSPNAGNIIGTLTGFTADGNFALEDNPGLTIGALSARFGSINIAGPTAASPTGSLILAGAITAGASASFSNALGIFVRTGAAVSSGSSLSLSTGGSITEAANSSLTGSSVTGTAVALSASSGITLAGTLTAGSLTAGTYTGLAVLDVTDGNIVGTAGSLRAGTLSGEALSTSSSLVASSGNANFATASGNTISALTNFSAAGNFALEDDAGLTVGALSAQFGGIAIAGPATGNPAGLLILAGDITAETSISMSNTLGIAELSGASVTSTASGLVLSTGGSITQGAGSSLSGGSSIGTALALTAGTGITLSGTLTAGTLASTGSLYSGLAAFSVTGGNMDERASGAIRAGTLTVHASPGATQGAGNVAFDAESSATTGNQIANLAASTAGGGFNLSDGQALTVTGAVLAGTTRTLPSSLALIAPAIDEVSGGSLAIRPPNGTDPGILSLVADQFSIFSGGVQNQGGIVALDLLNTTTFSVSTLSGATISPASLQNIEAGSGTIAIGSLDGTLASPASASSTGWTVGIGGTVELIDITAAFDLKTGNAAAALGLFSNGAITASAGVTVTTLYGKSENGTTALAGSNAISTLSAFSTAGTPSVPSKATAFLLDDDVSLTVLGPVTAGQGAVNIAVTQSSGLTLGGLAGGGNVTGTDIDLSAAGTLLQLSGTLSATGATNANPAESTPGSIVLLSTGGGIGLGSAQASALSAPAAHGVIVLYAGGGNITETPTEHLATGTLSAEATGNIQLTSASNTVSVIAPISTSLGTTSVLVPGLVASGSTGIAFTDFAPLTINDGALISAFGPAGTTGTGTGTVSLTAAALTLGTSAGVTIAAPGNVTLNATGNIAQTGGLVLSDADIALAAGSGITIGGNVTAGTLSGSTYSGAATFNVTTGNILETGSGVLRAGTLTSGGTAIGGSAGFGISAGNTLATLTNFKTTGNFALEDDTALAIGTLASTGGAITITGPTATVTAPGSLTITGPVSADTSISLSNALGITLSNALTATGLAAFNVTNGNIVETSGASIRAGTLSGEALSSATSLTAASGNATFTSTAGNTIGTLTNFTAAGNFSLEDNSGLTIGALASTFGSIAIAGPATGNPSGILALGGAITAGTSISFSNSLGISELFGARVAATTDLSLSTGGSISQAAGSSLTGSSSTGTAVAFSAGTGITLAGTTTAGTLSGGTYTGLAVINVTAGNINESAGILRAGTLSGEALSSATSLTAASGNANFSSTAGNTIGALTTFTAAGNFALEDNSGLTVGALASTFGSIAIAGPATGNPSGILTLAGDITAGTSISFSNSLGIAELAGAAVSGSSIAASTGGAFSEAASSSLTGSSSTGTAIALAAGTGITLAGTTTAGTLSGGAYTGLAVINVTAGNINESAGILRAGTLSGEALSSATSLTAASGNANFTSTAGNTIGTLTNFTAAGNFTLEDNSGLTIGALASTFGSIAIAGPATGNPSGILALGGDITAGTSISFSNSLGISEFFGARVAATTDLSLSTGGSISQAAGSSLTGSSSTGTAVALSASTGMTLAGTTTAGTLSGGTYTGLAVINVTGGNINESAGILRAGTLSGEALSSATSLTAASGNANFTSTAGNTIGTLTNFTAAGNFALEDNSGLTIGALASTFGSIAIAGPATGNPSGILTLAGAITAGTSISFSNSLGISEIFGARVAAATNLSLSTGGSISQAAGSSLTGSSSSGTAIALSAGSGITLAGNTTAGTLSGGTYTGLAVINVTAGNINESAGILRAGTLSGEALSSATSLTAASGNANFSSTAGNTIGTLTTFTAAGNFTLEDNSGLTVGALASTFGSIAIAGPATGNPSGILTLAGDITAGTSISFSNSLGIAELAGAAVSASSIAVSTGGAFSEAATSSLTGSSSTGTAIALAASTGITLAGTTTAGTLSGGAYTGLATMNAASGNIVETGGVLRAGTLTSNGATIGGSATFTPSAGNTISTLTNFATTGNFALEDDAGLTINGLSAGGSIDITGPSGASAHLPTGILVVSGAVSADLNLLLSNALGIAELSGGSITSTAGSVALVSGSGAIAQQAGGTMSGSNGLSLAAGGSTAFNSYLPAKQFGTINGIAFGGKLAATAGTLALTAAQGNITETGPGRTTSTGTLQADLLTVVAHTGTLTGNGNGLISLDIPSASAIGNQIVHLGASSSDGAFALSDGTGLTITGTVQAGLRATTLTALQIIAPAIDVTTGSLALVPPNGTKPGILSLVADQFTFATAGDVTTPGGIVALDLLNPGTSGATIFGIGPTATVSATSLANIRTNGGTLALGSLDGTLASPRTTNLAGWTTGEGGTVDQISIATGQTVALNTTAAALGLFTNATTGNVNGIADLGGISVGSLYGSAGGAFTEAANTSNSVGTLGVLTPAGTLLGFTAAATQGQPVGFRFTNAISLDILGPVTATGSDIDILVTGATGTIANSLTLGGTITRNGAPVLTGGNITGNDVFISAAGNILQSTGTIDATRVNGVAGLSAGGAITLQARTEGGTAGGAILLSAASGDVSETAAATISAGTLAAAASGNILLGAGNNTIGFIGPFASTTQNLFLEGLTAGGSTGIAFTDKIGLTIADGALISAFGPSSTGSVALSLTSGNFALGTATGATLAATGNIVLTAPGNIVQTGGVIQADGAISLAAGTAAAAGSIEQIGGSIAAGGSVFGTAAGPANGSANIVQTTLTIGQNATGSTITAGREVTLASATGSFAQTNSSITGSAAVTIDVLKNITQSATSTIAAPAASGTVILASASGSIITAGLIAGGGTRSPNGVFTPSGASDVLLSAGAGDIVQNAGGTIDAGTLAAAATGSIALPGNNQVSSIGSLGATLAGALPQTLTLYGLTAAGPSGITFTDTTSLGALQIGPDTGSHAVIDASGANATLAINMNGFASGASGTTYGSLVLGGAGASSLLAGGDVTLDALGSILQNAGTINSANAGVTLVSTFASVRQTGSTIRAAGDVSIDTGLDTDQTAGIIIAGGSLNILANGSVSQAANSLISASQSVSITAGLGATLSPPNPPGGNITQNDSTISAGGNVTLVADATSPAFGTISQSVNSTIGAGQVALLTSGQGSFVQDASSISGSAGVNLFFHGNVVSTGGLILSSGTSNPASPGTVSITSTNGAISSTLGSRIEADGTGSTLLLSAQGDIDAATVNTGTLAAAAGGNISLTGTNRIADIGAIGGFGGLAARTGSIDLADQLALNVQPGAVIDALAPSATITIGAAALALSSATIEAGGTVALNAAGALSQSGGVVRSDQASVSLDGQSVRATGGASVIAGRDIAINSSSLLLVDNAVLQAGQSTNGVFDGALSMSAGAAGIDAATGRLLAGTLAAFSAGPITLTDAANETAVIGTAGPLTGLTATGTLAVQDAQSLTIAAPVSASSSIGFTVSPGAFTEDAGIGITASGPLSINAANAVTIGGSLDSFGLAITAGGAVTEQSGAAITASAGSTISSQQSVEIDGSLTISGATHISAATDFLEGGGASINSGNTVIDATSGSATIDGALAVAGPLTITAAQSITEGQPGMADLGSITAGATSLTAKAGAITINGLLKTGQSLTASAGTDFIESATIGRISATGSLGITALDGIAINGTVTDGASAFSAGGSVSIAGSVVSGVTDITAGTAIDISGRLHAGTTVLKSANGPITVGGTVIGGATTMSAGGMIDVGGSLTAHGALTIDAQNRFTESQGADITAASASISTPGGSATIDGLLTLGGALNLTTGTSIAQGATGAISAGASASLLAPGTITLAGSLAAPSIILGEPSTSDIIWNNNTIRTGSAFQGATDAIDRLLQLKQGPGLLVDTASLQQFGTTFVDPLTGGSATLQITVQGKGTARFNNLRAPDAQLLLVLENGGFANGLIDVAGLNVFFTQGETPSQAANLFGVVGGHNGTAAAGAGFAHLFSNINYQINGCPIQSINCVLLSPVVVPVVNPVNDFAEGTQRKRHQDDDALPNVGEEDY